MSVPKTSVRVNVPGRSTFDKSFKNILTGKVGDLIPLVSKYVMPNSRGSLRLNLSAALPPLASDTFMRADLKVEAFLVPHRLVYGGYESWLTGKRYHKNSSGTISQVRAEIPVLRVGDGTAAGMAADLAVMGPGSLSDYLGLRVDPNNIPSSNQQNFNIFPFLAYHRVYDDWYKNPRLSQSLFTPRITGSTSISLSQVPFEAFDSVTPFGVTSQFDNGRKLGDLEHRNYGADYFTVAMANAQSGVAQSVTVSSNVFTIASLREANSLQQFAERSALGSPRLQDYLRAHYGADLSSGVAQRSILLGSASYPVYSKGVDAQSGVSATNNPFTSVGSQYGRGVAGGSDFVCEFECNEPSQLLVLVSLVPEANYGSGIDHEFLLLTGPGSQVDLPDPLLENTGNEPIYASELNGVMYGSGSNPGPVFGYVPKNTWHKTSRNVVHGLLRSGQSLASFVAQRTFAGGQPPTINTAFVRVNSTDLDNVTAVTAELSQYGFWLDSFVDLRVSEPLVESAIPSLQDPAYEHGRAVVLNQKTDL